jgi:hypothetical protein
MLLQTVIGHYTAVVKNTQTTFAAILLVFLVNLWNPDFIAHGVFCANGLKAGCEITLVAKLLSALLPLPPIR